MDVSYVNPFITATIETFKTMLDADLATGKVTIKNPQEHNYYISAIIGLSGEAKGMIALSFPKLLALKIASYILQTKIKIVGPEVTDALGEIANIIAGNAKQYLQDYKLSISLPNIVIGQKHRIEVQTGVPIIVVPFTFVWGEFGMEVALKSI